MKVRILIKNKEGVLDIEGKAIANALTNLGMQNFKNITKGTMVELEFTGKEEELPSFIKKACEELLVNDVIQTFEYQIIQ